MRRFFLILLIVSRFPVSDSGFPILQEVLFVASFSSSFSPLSNVFPNILKPNLFCLCFLYERQKLASSPFVWLFYVQQNFLNLTAGSLLKTLDLFCKLCSSFVYTTNKTVLHLLHTPTTRIL